MHHDDVLQGCLEAHRDLLRLEQEFHAWLQKMTGFDDAPAS